ncbi:hypothetical protein [Nocardia sp. XZ_19_369]|uniref:hypothetical protein n=1 Tax=Nocardia sp. XZ_19_369 TaxID=2769487 RepID=UPI00188FEEFD|nr:hypothetical protein [Nocardia sp. XZ_19_369]
MSNLHTALVDRVHLVDIESTKWGACKAVLRAIANHANEAEADMAWPGVELMMLETGLSESVIVRTTGLLARTGWIRKWRRFARSNMYRLNMSKLRSHQVARPSPRVVHMGEHLPALLFPGEDITELLPAGQPAPAAPPRFCVPGRSTARARAAKAAAAGTGNPQPAPGYARSASAGRADPAPGPVTPDRRESTRRIDGKVHADSTTEQLDNDQPTVSHPGTGGRGPAAESAPGCLTAEVVPAHTSGDPAPGTPARAARLLAGLSLPWPVPPSVIRLVTPVLEQRLAQGGWTEPSLAAWIETHVPAAILRSREPIKHPPGWLVSVLREIPATAPSVRADGRPGTRDARPPWCGRCESPQCRMITFTDGHDEMRRRCPDCHPSARTLAAV